MPFNINGQILTNTQIKLYNNKNIVRNGTMLYLDAAIPESYPGIGPSWDDLSGNNNTAGLVNGAGYSSNNSGYIILNGINNYIGIPNNTTLNSNVATVSIWFRYTTVNNYYGSLISKIDPSGSFNGWNIYIYNNVINAQIKANPATTDVSGTSISTNTWYNAVLVSVSGGISRLYLNGTLIGSANTVSYTVTNTQPLRIARSVDTFWSYFGGNVSSVLLYNRALSAPEVLQNFNANRRRYNV